MHSSAGAGADKIQRREIEASPIGDSQNTPGEKLPIFRPPGPLHWPTVLPRPLQVSRTRGLSGRGLAPRERRQPQGAARAARGHGLGAGSGLGPLGSQAFSPDRKQGTASGPSGRRLCRHTQNPYCRVGEGGEKMPFFPQENTSQAFISAAKGNFGGGKRGKGRGLWGEGREDSP